MKSNLIQTLKKHEFSSNAELNLHLVSKIEICALNRKWRKKNEITDVLSFGQVQVPNEKIRQLGDIFICFKQAKKQAMENSYTLQKEINFLACHGLEHLLGKHHS